MSSRMSRMSSRISMRREDSMRRDPSFGRQNSSGSRSSPRFRPSLAATGSSSQSALRKGRTTKERQRTPTTDDADGWDAGQSPSGQAAGATVTEDQAEVTKRVLEHMAALVQRAKAAEAAVEKHRLAILQVRSNLSDGSSQLREERDSLVQTMLEKQIAVSSVMSLCRQKESNAAVARRKRDEVFRQACREGGRFAALKAEVNWLKKFMELQDLK
eukprot:TRINITY_DN50656_c0_g1_i1.p2 TRINITY_DN50656_c0_g1~~TRINITY_DN50656_c0_g1_i1.p2  ORF type:complete len:215 (+),score=67.28 TRINITY_DN50656_c0_g1_i1:65-709(+)